LCSFHYIFKFFVPNNCMKVVVEFFFIHMRSIFGWFFYRIFNFFKIFLNNHRHNYTQYFFNGHTDGMKQECYFCLPFLLVNLSVIIFLFYQRKKITDGAFLSVIPSVN
jgi:hypothetical protein